MFAGYFILPKKTYIEEMGGTKRTNISLEEMIDLKNVYGLSLRALILSARDFGIIETEYKRWWYAEYLEDNPWESGLGHYAYPETTGREKRIDSIINLKKIEGEK